MIKNEATSKKSTMKENVVEAAINLFSKHGFSGASTAQIAKEAGCAEGTIFRYFPKKIDLLKYVAQVFIKRFMGGIATKGLYEILEKSDEMSAEKMVETIMYDRIELVLKNYEILKIVIYEINFHKEVKELFLEQFRESTKEISEAMASVLSKKMGIGKLDTYVMLRTLIGQIIGILLQLKLIQSSTGTELDKKEIDANLKNMVKTSAHIVIHGLKGMETCLEEK